MTCMLVVTSRRPGRVSAEWVLFPRRRGEGQQIAPRVGQPGSENCPPATRVPTRPFSDGGEDARPLAFADDPLILALMGWG